MRRYTAFTLIELLVVIAIIAMIAAILFPAFQSARERARQSSCASNEKQLGIGLMQYTNDYDELFPPGNEVRTGVTSVTGCTATTVSASDGAGWAGQLYSYVRNTQVFACPDDTTKATAPNYVLSYLYNINLTAVYANPPSCGYGATAGQAYYVSKLASPARTVLLCEGASTAPLLESYETSSYAVDGIFTASWGGFNSYGTGPLFWTSACGSSTTWTCGTTPRHFSGSLFLACDGHVKFLLPSQVCKGSNAPTPAYAPGQAGQSAEGTLYPATTTVLTMSGT